MTCRSFLTLLLFQMFTSYTLGSSLASNATRFNSSHVVGFQPALPGDALPVSSSQIHAPAEEPASSGLGENRPYRTIGADSVGGMGAGLPTMSRSKAQLDFKEENVEDVAPRWRGETLQPDGSVRDRSLFLSEPDDSSPVIKVSFSEPDRHRQIEIPAQEVQGGDPTSWTSEFYDYLSPEYSTTESYADDELSTPADMEDENIRYDPAGAAANGACLLGFVRRNGTCRSPCDVYTSYCFNGGQCYVVEGIGAFCRCNVQNYVWNKGSRCESVITQFQVMCIVVTRGGVLLILFMIIVFFSKRLHVLKSENSQLRNAPG
ncbi:hypothetical protein AMELA_G00211520 [Ameiurus melas]|uniref:Chondroitin sulfate proteoglycan 5 n=1 Tax=Ameiurus melas TaxID=219545 RepID=A0A7J6A719_AMEME|nr:hypothetical protein AMELA_G00211520 [Ameiurus melas]